MSDAPEPRPKEELSPAERRAKALSLRLAGASPAEVGALLGCTTSQAWRLIRSAMAEAIGLNVEEIRQFSYLRCERLINKYMPIAELGDTDAGRLIALLQAQQAKLLGFDQQVPGMGGGDLKVTIVRKD